MIDASVLRALQAAGATTDMIIAAVEADGALEAARLADKRANNAERQRRFKAKRRSVGNADNALPRVTAVTAPPNEYISNPPGFDVSNETSAVSDFADQVVDAWNSGIAGSPLPVARKLNPERRKHLKARVREHGEEAVFTAIGNLCKSDFHSGRSGQWMEGNLGWILKSPENFQKMLERTNAQPPGSSPSNLSSLIEQAKRYGPRPQAA